MLLGVYIFTNKWVIACLFIIGTITMWGFSSVKSHFYLEYIRKSKYKASLLSLNTFMEKIISAILSLLMGFMVLKNGYKSGFMLFGIILLFVFILSLFSFRKKNKEI